MHMYMKAITRAETAESLEKTIQSHSSSNDDDSSGINTFSAIKEMVVTERIKVSLNSVHLCSLCVLHAVEIRHLADL